MMAKWRSHWFDHNGKGYIQPSECAKVMGDCSVVTQGPRITPSWEDSSQTLSITDVMPRLGSTGVVQAISGCMGWK